MNSGCHPGRDFAGVRAARPLDADRAELQAIYDHAPLMLCVVDAQRRVCYANPAFTALTGVSASALTDGVACGIFGCINALDDPRGCGFGHNCTDCALRLAIEDTLATGNPHRNILYRTTLVGGGAPREVQLLGYTARIMGAGEPRLLLCLADVTEIKRAEHERESLRRQLEHARHMESVGRLAGGVAHDFNNLLNVILGHTELLLERSGNDALVGQSLKEIRDAAQRSAQLTRQLLGFARKQTIAPRILDLNETVELSLTLIRRLVGETIELVWQPAGGLWPVKMDPVQVDQIVANVCLNARDAISGAGRIEVRTANRLLTEADCASRPDVRPGRYVELAIADNGRGFAREDLDHLFEPFFGAQASVPGGGLGLATVYGIVKQNEGCIDVASAPGQGTTIGILLPAPAGLAAAPAMPAPATPEGGNETVLLVEDEAPLLRIDRIMLERMGYRVLAAGSPGEALRLAREHGDRIQLLITDVVMPEMNGRELARAIKAFLPDLKCLFASGYAADIVFARGILEPGMHFIEKPFSKRELAGHVRRALAAPP